MATAPLTRFHRVLEVGCKLNDKLPYEPLCPCDADLKALSQDIHAWISSPATIAQFQLPKRSITVKHKTTQRAKFGKLRITLTKTRDGYTLRVYSDDVGGEVSHETLADFTVSEVKDRIVKSVNRSREFRAQMRPRPDFD